jgi:ubiquinone/menaquinone biosynthesis C-methylase UbiE
LADWNFSLPRSSPSTVLPPADALPRTIAGRTRRVYDALAGVYPASTYFFHSKAHECALEQSGIRDGMNVLEIATGSGEMFRRLAEANPNGKTFGLDLSPNMAARTQALARKRFPNASVHCGAVDARYMPFRTESFDAVVCCYLFELLAREDIRMTLGEVRRLLRPGGTFTLVVIGQNVEFFNRVYDVAGKLVPAFWGRQVEESVPTMVRDAGLAVERNQFVRQGFYPSRVLVFQKPA